MKAFSSQSATGADDSTVSHKATCDLTMDQAPVINGLELGMTADQVLALFPGSADDAEVRSSLSRPPNKFGGSSFVIRPAKYDSKDKFAGIIQIVFRLLDGRVSAIYVGYSGPQWSHVDKFVAKFTEGTNLPPSDQWQAYIGMDTQLKTLKCVDFDIRVFAGDKGGNLNYVDMRDVKAEKKLSERTDKATEKATPGAKPSK